MDIDIGSVLTSVLGFVGASGIISSLVLKRIDKLEKMLERREHDRVEENVVRGEVIHRTGKLTEANTIALRTVTTEDACDCEFREYRRAADKLGQFMRAKSAEYLHSN